MKIAFVTFHNWETKRHGGFHKLAEASAKAGNETLFFSFARPYFIVLKHEERLNAEVLKKLCAGVTYKIDGNGSEILNFTWPTCNIPQPIRRFIPNTVNKWFDLHSFTPFSKIQKKYLQDTDVFVFESCEAIYLIDKIRKYNPKAKFVYRPSDPMMVDGCSEQLIEDETHILKNVDMTFIVNQEGLDLYRRKVSGFDQEVRYIMLPNGVSTEQYTKQYKKPSELNRQNTFLYVGARIIEWNLIKKAAMERPDYSFIIVCPEKAPDGFVDVPNKNIIYINGIPSSDVPAWVTNCDVVIVPNPKGWYKIKPWGITAKYYQAMAAHKPIVVYEDTDSLLQYGVWVAHEYDKFISYLDEAIKLKEKEYSYAGRDWKTVTSQFTNIVEKL